jgi:nucleoside-diphosphate-sugar epimerase
VNDIPQPIALTGGTGFVGSHLVDTLCAAGIRPRVLVRDPGNPRWIAGAEVEWIAGDLEDRAALDRLVGGAGTVIHLAGVVRAGRPVEFDRGNRVGTSNLVAAVARRAPEARVVHVSSLAAAGPSADPRGRRPDDPAAPVSSYGRSKLAAEEAVAELGNERRWCVLRPPAIYGPRDTDVLEFFKMAARGVAAVPAGERWITVAYVADVVRALVAAAADATFGATFHLGEPEPRTLVDLLETLAAAGGCSVRVVSVPATVVALAGGAGSALQRLGFRRVALTRDKARELVARHWTADTTGSLEALGVNDVTPFDDGAAATWRWYRARGWVG